MKRIFVAFLALGFMTGGASAENCDLTRSDQACLPEMWQYGPLQKDGTRQGPPNCQHPIIDGGSHWCPAGEHPREVVSLEDFNHVFANSGGGGQ
jgi:hypothetical protein